MIPVLTDKQAETINLWLCEAYEAGYRAGTEQGEPEPEPVDGKLYPVHNCIPDLSSYQPTPDYDKLCDGADFVILRARYCSKTDKTFEGHAKALNERDMPFAVYDYVTLISHSNARQQAEAIFELCEKYHPRIGRAHV